MTLLAFVMVGGCLVIALFLNNVLDKRAEKKRLKAKQPPRRH